MRACNWLVLLISLFGNLAVAQSEVSSVDSLFRYGTIPFGQSFDEVLDFLRNTRQKPEDSSVDVVCDYGIDASFEGGVFGYGNGFGCGLRSDIIRSISFQSEYDKIRLYFARDFKGDTTYSLMMVVKELPHATGDLESVFGSLKKTISGKIPVTPQVSSKRYGTMTQRLQYNETFPAKVAIWTTEKTKVFLLANSWLSTCYRTMIYRSEPQWKMYLRSCQAAKDARMKSIEEQSGADGKRF